MAQNDLESRRDGEEGRITDEAVEALRARIGLPAPRVNASFEFAGIDSLRNYARGIGDVNPFFRDPEYARKTVWGKYVAQPTFILYMGVQSESDMDGRLAATGSGDPLRGVHGFYSGEELRFFRHIVEGDRLTYKKGLAEVLVKESKMGGKSVHEIHETLYRNDAGEIIGQRRQRLIRVERTAARTTRDDRPTDVPHSYSVEEMDQINAAYENEYIRGSEPRYFEDVEVGEQSVPLVRGPYTTTSYIVYAEGTGPRNNFHRSHSDAYAYRKAHPRAFPLNHLGVPDTVARVHWDRDMALRAGLPETYDYGGERIAWLSTAVTHWMGDSSFLAHFRVRLSKFNFVGDVVWLTATVASKDESNHSVELEVTAKNQRDEVNATAKATVILPTRAAGEVSLPLAVPADLSALE